MAITKQPKPQSGSGDYSRDMTAARPAGTKAWLELASSIPASVVRGRRKNAHHASRPGGPRSSSESAVHVDPFGPAVRESRCILIESCHDTINWPSLLRGGIIFSLTAR
jgi:hypothetical protein